MSRITGPFDKREAEEIVDRALDHKDMREFLMKYLTGEIDELPMAVAIGCLAQALAEGIHEQEQEERASQGLRMQEEPGLHPIMGAILGNYFGKRS